ncbi:MAG: TatD family nuclease-associated radical SAM protein [Bacillota bacterium]
MKDFILTYTIEDRLYINVTNRCTNSCAFCIRNTERGVGYNLWLSREPGPEEIIKSLDNLEKYSEVIFCGYGEPLIRLDLVKEVAGHIKKEYGSIVRINTNGQSDLLNGSGSIRKLKGLVDRINISLNAHSAEKYADICRPAFGLMAYGAIIDFTRSCVGIVPNIILSVVDWPGVNIDKCRDIADSLGADFRLRKHDG